MNSDIEVESLADQIDWLLGNLAQRNRDAIVKRGFRLLKGVGLHNGADYQIKDDINWCERTSKNVRPLNSRILKRSLFTSMNWKFDRKFCSKKMAIQFLKDNYWREIRGRQCKADDGRKVYYECTQESLNGIPCGTMKCLKYPFDSDEVSMYTNNNIHTEHSVNSPLNNIFSVTVKTEEPFINMCLPGETAPLKMEIENGIDTELYLSQESLPVKTEVYNGIDIGWCLPVESRPVKMENHNRIDTGSCLSQESPPIKMEVDNEIDIAWCLPEESPPVQTEIHNKVATSSFMSEESRSINTEIDNWIDIGCGLKFQEDIGIEMVEENPPVYLPESSVIMDNASYTILKRELIIEEGLESNSLEKEILPELLSTDKNVIFNSDTKKSNSIVEGSTNIGTNEYQFPYIGYTFKEKFTNMNDALHKMMQESENWTFNGKISQIVIGGYEIHHSYKCNYTNAKGCCEARRLLIDKNCGEIHYYQSCHHIHNDTLTGTQKTKVKIHSNPLQNNNLEKITDYVFSTRFRNHKSAIDYMETLNLSFYFKIMLKDKSNIDYFRCNVPLGIKRYCPVSCYLQYTDKNSITLMYKRSVPHMAFCPKKILPIHGNTPPKNGADKKAKTKFNDSEKITEKQKWIFEKEFKTSLEAVAFIKGQGVWSFKNKSKSKDGFIKFYGCSLLKNLATECAAAKFIHVQTGKKVVSLYRTQQDHTHNRLTELSTPESSEVLNNIEMKSKLKQLVTAGFAPESILNKLNFNNSINQHLYTWIKRTHREMIAPSKSDYAKRIEDYFEFILKPPNPIHENRCFCVSLNIESNKTFQCFLSTRCLLKNALDSKSVHINSSCELRWRRITVTIIGTTDVAQKFHPFGIALSPTRTECEYKFMFEAIQNGTLICYNRIFNPEYLIADNNKHIHNAFAKVFPTSKIAICPKEALAGISEDLFDFAPNNLSKTSLREDFLKVCKLTTLDLFLKVFDLFCQKWQIQPSTDLMLYVERISNWFRVFPQQYTPDSSNSIRFEYEKLSQTIQNTFNEKLVLKSFLNRIKVDMLILSMAYTNIGPKNFYTKISSPLYENAMKWITSGILYRVEYGEPEMGTRYYVPPGDEKVICKKKYQKHLAWNYESFDEFFDNYYSFWCVVRYKNNYIQCNCPYFWKHCICEHSVGIGAILNIVKKNQIESAE